MNEADADQSARRSKSRFWYAAIVVAGIATFVVGVGLEDYAGIPFDTAYRIVCAAICLMFIYKLGRDYPADAWPQTGLWIALLTNAAIFFTPLVDRPSSRGELMLFALPDAVVVLAARIATYHARDVHQRAMRQQMILGLVVAIVFCTALYGLVLFGPQPRR